MSSARPPATYARRWTRQRRAENASASVPSSPLEELSPSKQDVTYSEMSRRMKKRSRQVLSDKRVVRDEDIGEPFAKKLKRPSQLNLRNSVEDSLVPTVPSTPVMPSSLHRFPLDTHQIYDSLFETPLRPSDDMLIKSYAQPLLPDQLSPVPVGRRLSRTSSRNLKENSGRLSRQGLATPFHSRPTSRTSSPRRNNASSGKRPMHTKSRTLSSSFSKQQFKSAGVSYTDATQSGDSLVDSIFSPTVQRPLAAAPAHTRSGSIPSVSSNLLDHVSPEDWLVPAKALSRSPPSLEDMELDDYTGEHSSFYLDAPVKVSTPPRRRRTTVTLRNFKAPVAEDSRSSSGSVPMDLTDPLEPTTGCTVAHDAMQEDETSHSLAHPRRRRKTVVHMSGDSIFSSALDFSAYITEFSPTQAYKIDHRDEVPDAPPGIVHPNAASYEVHPLPAALDPAFSPASASAPASVIDAPASAQRLVPPAEQSPAARTASVSDGPRATLNRRSQPLQTPTTSGNDDLTEMFNTLGLEAAVEADDYGVDPEKTVTLQRSASAGPAAQRTLQQSHPPVDAGSPLAQPVISAGIKSARPAELSHRRKRGDTIRASDFARPAILESASMAGPSKAPATRRTRSGTVILAKTPGAGRGRGSRRQGKLPTIQMKIDDEPLPNQASDEDDDELLLKRGVYWQDP